MTSIGLYRFSFLADSLVKTECASERASGVSETHSKYIRSCTSRLCGVSLNQRSLPVFLLDVVFLGVAGKHQRQSAVAGDITGGAKAVL